MRVAVCKFPPASFTHGAAGVGGFNNSISLNYSSASGLTCVFNPYTITPGATERPSAASVPPIGGCGFHAGIFGGLLSGLGLFGGTG